MDNPGIAIPADEIAAKIGLSNGRHGLAGVVAWPSRQCAELRYLPPFRFDNSAAPNEAGTYWMDPETAELFPRSATAVDGQVDAETGYRLRPPLALSPQAAAPSAEGHLPWRLTR